MASNAYYDPIFEHICTTALPQAFDIGHYAFTSLTIYRTPATLRFSSLHVRSSNQC